MNGLQRIVDALARSTNRAVAIHDREGRILAYSSHDEPVDEVRQRSILARKTPADAIAWSRSQGVERAAGPVRVPANPELGMDARVCCPVRFQDQLLGLLWLVDPGGALADEDLESVRAAAETAGLAMHREQLVAELERGKERELVRDLLSEVPELWEQAANELVERNLLVGGPAVVALVVRPVRDRNGISATDEVLRLAIEKVLTSARMSGQPRHSLPLVRHDHGLLLLSMARQGSAGAITKTAQELHAAMERALRPHPEWRAVVGIGDVREGLTEAYATYRHATKAAEVASIVESFRGIAAWPDLGVYKILLNLPPEDLKENSLPPGLLKLMDSPDGPIWLETLERYLDLGCDARATAAELSVQRGSIYYRLRRIEELAEVDLGSGDDRLALHLGLKIARLTGLLRH